MSTPPKFPAHADETWEFDEASGEVISRTTYGDKEYAPEVVAGIVSDSAADPHDGDGHIIAASRYMLSLLEELIEAGGYDDEGDFILYHREGASGLAADARDPEVIEKINALIKTIRSQP